MNGRPIDYYAGLLNELLKLPSETECLEFKYNKADLKEIGEYYSVLVNSPLSNETIIAGYFS